MKWKRISAPALFLSCSLILGIGCSGTDKTDCKQKIQEIRTMIDTTLMDYGDYEIMLPPSTYCPGDFIRYVFAVPKDNMVGTNELDNAIKLLEFKNDEDLEQHTVKKDFMEMVTGPFEFRFLPVWSDKEIAYSQSRGFLLVNLPEKNVGIHTVIPGLDDLIETLQVFDANNHTFVFEINLPGEGLGNYEKVLKVIRFENDTFTVLAEHPAGIKTSAYTEPWFVYQKKIFIYRDSTTKLEVFDENFKPLSHPLADAFNRNQVGFRCLQEIAVHPNLPFALVIEGGKMPTKSQLAAADALPDPADEKARDAIYKEVNRLTLYLFRWNETDEKKRFVPLLSLAGSIWNSYNPANCYSHFTFSPDGKWLVFRDGSMRGDNVNSSQNPVFVAVPIDEKLPVILGKPIKLGNAMRGDAIEPKSVTWTTKPTAFIMCDGLAIYRWNLDRYKQLRMQKVKMPPGAADPFK
jgi:hypothetical protein